jgi:hypothetical protein
VSTLDGAQVAVSIPGRPDVGVQIIGPPGPIGPQGPQGVPGVGLPNLVRPSGYWYFPMNPNGPGTSTLSAGFIFVAPWIADSSQAVANAQIDVSGVTTAGHFDACVYAGTGAGSPGALVAETGPIAVSVAGVFTAALIFTPVVGHIYWVGGVVLDGTLGMRTLSGNWTPPVSPLPQTGAAPGANYSFSSPRTAASTYTTSPLPATFPAYVPQGVTPRLAFQVA